MTASMPNPFLSEIPRAGSPAPSVPLSARGASGVSRFKFDERAFMAALLSNSVVATPSATRQPPKGVSSLDLAAVPSGAAALSGGDISESIATLRALAAIDAASAEHSSTSVKA